MLFFEFLVQLTWIVIKWWTWKFLHLIIAMSFFFFIKFVNLNYTFLSVFFIFFIISFVDHPLFFRPSFFCCFCTLSFSCKIPSLGGFSNYPSCKILSMSVIGGRRNTLEGDGGILGPCNIWEFNVWLLLKIRAIISCTHHEFCDHSLYDSLCDSSSTLNPFMFWEKKFNTLLPKPCQNKPTRKMREWCK